MRRRWTGGVRPGVGSWRRRRARLVRDLGVSTAYLGFAMVSVNNEFWREQFAAVPLDRRLLLLPHCLRHVTDCRGSYDAHGLACAECGACALGPLKAEAESLGYEVLIAEGTPAVVETLARGRTDAILGMACLDSLERAFPRVSELGIPNVAVPLLTNGCVTTTAEIEVLLDWLRRQDGVAARPMPGYLGALRGAEQLFGPGALEELLDGVGGALSSSPEGGTEAVALDWLREGGKRFRPFITLAGYAALSGRRDFPTAVRRVALAIEAFHKASLVHDDIEDNDPFRYGRQTLHRRYGVGTALNVGDYLVGLGYGLVAATRQELSAEAVADILGHLSEAHTKLCRGQGEELFWARRDLMEIRPEDVQRIYALKTAPAFEAALCAGMRAARDRSVEPAERDLLRRYCRLVGVAFQLLNDLKDWEGDSANKCVAGQDSLAWRPTMLLAFALEAGDTGPLRALASDPQESADREERLDLLRALYEGRGAFEKGRRLVVEYRRHAVAAADAARPEALRDLLHFIVEAVL